MILWHPEPPQGFSAEQELITIGRPTIPRFDSPQGRITDIPGDKLLALYPPIEDNTFQFYKFYQINRSMVPSDQSLVAIVIVDHLPPGTIQSPSQFDIRVFGSNGSLLRYHPLSVIINVDGSADIIIWFKMVLVRDLEYVQLTFGKIDATDESLPNLVHDNCYVGWWHLNGNGLDLSIPPQNNLTVNGTLTVPALIGNGLNFRGLVTDFLNRDNFSGFPSGDISVQFTIKTNGNDDGMFSYAVSNFLDNHFLIFMQEQLRVYIEDVPYQSNINFSDNNFHIVTVTWRKSDGELIIYIDGDEADTTEHQAGAAHTDGGSLVIGQDQDNLGNLFVANQALNGILQELHLSDVVRSPDYVKAQVNNMLFNDAFWFKTPLLENGKDNFLVDHIGRRILAVGQ